jgi:hypothetical protein
VELPDGGYGGYECPHCDEEFDYEEEDVLLVGMPTKFDEEHEKETLYSWRDFFIGLGISSFWFIPVMLSMEPGYYGPDITQLGEVFCWLWPLSGLVTAIVGFSMGKKALGLGGLVGLALMPGLFFFGCLFAIG